MTSYSLPKTSHRKFRRYAKSEKTNSSPDVLSVDLQVFQPFRWFFANITNILIVWTVSNKAYSPSPLCPTPLPQPREREGQDLPHKTLPNAQHIIIVWNNVKFLTQVYIANTQWSTTQIIEFPHKVLSVKPVSPSTHQLDVQACFQCTSFDAL